MSSQIIVFNARKMASSSTQHFTIQEEDIDNDRRSGKETSTLTLKEYSILLLFNIISRI